METEFLKTKKAIEIWLDFHHIVNYELVPDPKYHFTINVDNDVNLSNSFITWIPVKFNKIRGSFNCSNNYLTSLEFSPSEVNGDFICSYNKLTSLEFSPPKITKFFFL